VTCGVQDEFLPRLVDTLTGRLAVPEGALVAAGGNATFCDATVAKYLYAWGKLKISGDGQMYPAAFMDMTGWNVRSMACGPATYAIAAEKSAVTWGAAHNNELAYGRNGKKSSANPAKVMALEGMYTHQARALTVPEVAGDESMQRRLSLQIWWLSRGLCLLVGACCLKCAINQGCWFRWCAHAARLEHL
jgi:hypothetical protein